jgi:CIC family chloride channel protein
VFEEVARRFALRLTLATLIACSVAIGVARLMVGDRPDFLVAHLSPPPFSSIVSYLVLGALFGLLGAAYNRVTVWGLDAFQRLTALPLEVRAALVGGTVGLLAWIEPTLVGDGDGLNQQVLDGGLPLATLATVFAVRWLIGPWSYSAGTPGGLFAPLLVVGSAFGAIFGVTLNELSPALAPQPIAFAVVGMAAFFTAVVRAPLTGITLVVEMTATTTLLVPMLSACFAAAVVAALVRSEPIYDTLRTRTVHARRGPAPG